MKWDELSRTAERISRGGKPLKADNNNVGNRVIINDNAVMQSIADGIEEQAEPRRVLPRPSAARPHVAPKRGASSPSRAVDAAQPAAAENVKMVILDDATICRVMEANRGARRGILAKLTDSQFRHVQKRYKEIKDNAEAVKQQVGVTAEKLRLGIAVLDAYVRKPDSEQAAAIFDSVVNMYAAEGADEWNAYLQVCELCELGQFEVGSEEDDALNALCADYGVEYNIDYSGAIDTEPDIEGAVAAAVAAAEEHIDNGQTMTQAVLSLVGEAVPSVGEGSLDWLASALDTMFGYIYGGDLSEPITDAEEDGYLELDMEQPETDIDSPDTDNEPIEDEEQDVMAEVGNDVEEQANEEVLEERSVLSVLAQALNEYLGGSNTMMEQLAGTTASGELLEGGLGVDIERNDNAEGEQPADGGSERPAARGGDDKPERSRDERGRFVPRGGADTPAGETQAPDDMQPADDAALGDSVRNIAQAVLRGDVRAIQDATAMIQRLQANGRAANPKQPVTDARRSGKRCADDTAGVTTSADVLANVPDYFPLKPDEFAAMYEPPTMLMGIAGELAEPLDEQAEIEVQECEPTAYGYEGVNPVGGTTIVQVAIGGNEPMAYIGAHNGDRPVPTVEELIEGYVPLNSLYEAASMCEELPVINKNFYKRKPYDRHWTFDQQPIADLGFERGIAVVRDRCAVQDDGTLTYGQYRNGTAISYHGSDYVIFPRK